MTSLTIGPFMVDAGRLSGGLAIATFLIVSAVLAAIVDRRLGRWADQTLPVGLAAARIGHVLKHYDSFAAEPWRVFAIWQGGFSLLWGLIAVVLVSVAQVRSTRVALASAFTVGASFLVWTVANDVISTASAQSVPTQEIGQLDGGPTTLQGNGKPVVINFWATWCPPCRSELPLLSSVAQAHKDDVLFFFANQGEEPQAIKTYLQSQHLTLDHVLLDRTMALPQHYQTPGLPVTLFVRPNGTLMTAVVGEISQDILTEDLGQLLEGK